MSQRPNSLARDPRAILAALWLTALAAVVVLLPMWIPGDGLVWSPGSKGLVIDAIAQDREVTFAPGQRIVYFNGTPWESTRALHRGTPFFPLQSQRISYEIREGEWKLRRQVLQATLPFSVSLATYWRPAAVLVLWAVLSWVLGPRWKPSAIGNTALPAMGSALALLTIGNQNLTLLTLFQLRHLELAALLLAFGLGELLRRFAGGESRFVNALPWIAMTGVALSWVVLTDRWQWWNGVLGGFAMLGALTISTGLFRLFQLTRLRRQ